MEEDGSANGVFLLNSNAMGKYMYMHMKWCLMMERARASNPLVLTMSYCYDVMVDGHMFEIMSISVHTCLRRDLSRQRTGVWARLGRQ